MSQRKNKVNPAFKRMKRLESWPCIALRVARKKKK